MDNIKWESHCSQSQNQKPDSSLFANNVVDIQDSKPELQGSIHMFNATLKGCQPFVPGHFFRWC